MTERDTAGVRNPARLTRTASGRTVAQMALPGAQVRAIARRLIDRAQLLQAEAISARGSGAKRAALFLETIAAGVRNEGLALARGFPAGGDDGPPPPPEDPPFGPEEPTPTTPPKAA